VYLARESTESKSPTAILSTLGDISDISDRLAIEIGEFLEIKKCPRVSKVTDLSDDT
jgi:hypothetical protein